MMLLIFVVTVIFILPGGIWAFIDVFVGIIDKPRSCRPSLSPLIAPNLRSNRSPLWNGEGDCRE
jgi:hypothetical protein